MAHGDSLKLRTARSVKWNAIDRLATQAIYAATGIVLAWLLSPADFGLVGAALIFQAFALILIDSGFSSALLQRKQPSRLDYSTALWFNLGVAAILYIVLYLCAPLIADCFQGDERIVPLARLMFVTMMLNASSIVQVNQLTKRMHMRPVAIANLASLALGGAVAVVLAAMGYGPWAIVWQAIASSASKSAILWLSSGWTPLLRFSPESLRSLLPVGAGMMATSFLNTLFTNIYSFCIGNRQGMAQLGYYTQSDKWSKMGVMSISQTLTSSFVPPLSAAQDDPERFRRLCSKMNRLTAYVLFPFMLGLIAMAQPIFHSLFGTKWDPSIPIFQLLLARGIFTVLTSLYNNYLLALGRARAIVRLEVLRDSVALAALLATLPTLAASTATRPLWGIEVMVWGQIGAAAIAWAATLRAVSSASGAKWQRFIADCAPYAAITLAILPVLWGISLLALPAWPTMLLQAAAGAAIYFAANSLLRSRIQADAIAYFKGKL